MDFHIEKGSGLMLDVNKGNTNMEEVISYLLEAFYSDMRKKEEKNLQKLQIKKLKQQEMMDKLEVLVKGGL